MWSRVGHHCGSVCPDVASMMPSPAGRGHLQLNKVHVSSVPFHLFFPGSSAACHRCSLRGCTVAVAVPAISFPSAGKEGQALSSHGSLFCFKVPSGLLLASHWSLLGHMPMPGCKGVWESGPTWHTGPAIRQERAEWAPWVTDCHGQDHRERRSSLRFDSPRCLASSLHAEAGSAS